MKLTVRRLGHLGTGIAEGPDGDIFLPFTLPGEEVEVLADQPLNARILIPSPDRIKAPCPHFRTCGGCSLQHASDDFVAGWKTDMVRKALVAQGLEAAFRPIITSPPHSRRRATFAARRTKKAVLVGFHGRASDQIVAIPSCTLLHPDLMAAQPILAALTRIGATRKGELSLAVARSEAGLDINVTDAKPADGPLLAELGALAQRHKLARLSWNGEVVVTIAPPVQIFGRARVVPPEGGFLQATSEGEAVLVAAVAEAMGGARTIADLFAGSGTFSLPLAKQAEVLAVEGDAAALAALDRGWRNAPGLKPVKTEVRDLFRRPLLPSELGKFAAVVLDPPRAGCKAQAEQLVESGVGRLAMVSCNPVTFARDALILVGGGFRIDWVQVVDQFRWSPHVELVAALTRP